MAGAAIGTFVDSRPLNETNRLDSARGNYLWRLQFQLRSRRALITKYEDIEARDHSLEPKPVHVRYLE